MERNSFVFYRSFYEALADLKDKDRYACIDAICRYALYGEEPEAKGVVSMVLKLTQPSIDRNNDRYLNGMKGGRPPLKKNQTETKVKPKVIEEETKGEPYVDVYVDVDVDEDVDVYGDGDVDVDVSRVKDGATKTTDTPTPEPTRIPTIDVVADESVEKGYNLSFDSIKGFMEYNQSHGWKMNWHDALKKWADREKEREKKKAEPKKNNFTSFENQHQYDFDALKGILAQPVGGAG